MDLRLYVLVDAVNNDSVIMTALSYTDGACVRELLPFCNARNKNWTNDYRLYHIGTVSPALDLMPCARRLVSWDTYKTPEIPVDPN